MKLFLMVKEKPKLAIWLDYHCCSFEGVSVKSENVKSEVVITKEMEEEEKQLMEEGERIEKEMMEKVCFP